MDFIHRKREYYYKCDGDWYFQLDNLLEILSTMSGSYLRNDDDTGKCSDNEYGDDVTFYYYGADDDSGDNVVRWRCHCDKDNCGV